jgi:hypothetical protein
MITLILIPNFKGTKLETVKALLISVLIDCAYLLPILF